MEWPSELAVDERDFVSGKYDNGPSWSYSGSFNERLVKSLAASLSGDVVCPDGKPCVLS